LKVARGSVTFRPSTQTQVPEVAVSIHSKTEASLTMIKESGKRCIRRGRARDVEKIGESNGCRASVGQIEITQDPTRGALTTYSQLDGTSAAYALALLLQVWGTAGSLAISDIQIIPVVIGIGKWIPQPSDFSKWSDYWKGAPKNVYCVRIVNAEVCCG